MPTAKYWTGSQWIPIPGPAAGQVWTQVFGDGVSTTFQIWHGLGSRNVIVAVYRNSAPYDEVEADIERTDTNSITVRTYPYVPAANEFVVAVASGGTPAVLNLSMDGWHVVGNPGEPTFQNSWTNYGGGYQSAAFRKSPDGKVTIRGLVTGGTASATAGGTGVAWTLPPGYRPVSHVTAAGSLGGTPAQRIDIQTGGTVQMYSAGPGLPMGIDGITFDTDTVSQAASVSVQPMDRWHLVGDPGEPAFLNAWVNYAIDTYSPAGFRKMPDGRVALKGLIKNGTVGANVPIFTLPVGYRPPRELLFAPDNNQSTTTDMRVRVNGDVCLNTGVNTWLALDGVDFDTELVSGYSAGAIVPSTNPLVAMDSWHFVGASGEPAFGSGWGTGGMPAAQTARFRKYPEGRVRLAGLLNAAAGFTFAGNTTFFTLPVGYRPTANCNFTGQHYDGSDGSIDPVRVFVLTDGRVQIASMTGASYSGAAGSQIAIDGIEFDIETVLQTTSITAQPLDKWHNLGDPGEPPFQGGSQYASFLPVGFRKDPFGRVHLRGMINGPPTAGTLFTLPAGYRPAATVLLDANANGQGRVDISSSGVVTNQLAAAWVSLDGMYFDTDSSTGYTTATFPYLPVTMDDWHTVGAAGEPAFQGAWVSYDGGATFQVPQFRKDNEGRVFLRGQAKSGASGTVAFTLPVGFRPPKGLRFSGVEQGTAGPTTDWNQVNVYPDGTVVLYSNTTAISSLDGINFDTDSVRQTASVSAQPLEAWHLVGATGEPAFQAGVSNLAGDTAVGFRKYPDGRVRLKGCANTGAVSTQVFQLPVGYRPSTDWRRFMCTDQSGNAVYVYITALGQVMKQTAAPTNVDLSTVEFDTETQSSYPSAFVQINAPTKVTSLPVAPVDGQEVYFVADAANGVLWHLRYNAGSASAYKWELVGGSSLYSLADGHVETTSATHVALSGGPSIVAPLSGDYEIEFGGRLYTVNAAGTSAQMNIFVGAAMGSGLDSFQGSAGASITLFAANGWRKVRAAGVAVGTVFEARYKANSGGNAAFENRSMTVLPVRVG